MPVCHHLCPFPWATHEEPDLADLPFYNQIKYCNNRSNTIVEGIGDFRAVLYEDFKAPSA